MLASNWAMSRLKWVATQECRCGRLTGSRSWGSVANVPDDADAKRAVRLLADHPVLHLRHYGQDRQEDLHLD
jgi:hypothetical protein